MGGCASTSNHSTCSSRSNGERVSPECLGISMFSRKRIRKTFSDPVTTLQHLTSIPNRIFKNGKSRTSCIFTQQGRKGINQDAMVVWEDFMAEDVTFCGVFDGHGPHGHLVARKVRDALPLKLASFLQSFDSKHNGSTANCCSGDKKLDVVDPDKDGGMEDKVDYLWREAFLKSYKAMDKELRSHPNLDCFCSGSTAITLVKQGSNLFMGYIGDSRAIMASKDSNDSMVAVQLTVDLKPDLPKEAERIKRCKGRVFALQDEPEVQRVWLPFDDAPGLAMARAFGDFCLKEYGVISVPEFSHHILTERDKFIVLASDGVWDVLSNEEVIEIVSSAPTRASAARILVDSAAREWKTKYPTSKMDDCAVVCLFLDGKMDSESDNEDQCFSSATLQSNHSGNAVESDDGQNSEPSLQRNFTVRSAEENDTYKRIVAEVEANQEAMSTEEQNWLGLEGVTRVNSLVQLPRFSEERPRP
ncbi:probable protein phosphatase 2C 52 [Solanum lycopersicum]|uniref:protein-serine/threonine phosphatase n=2 Tax=Solanum subgen. Lycopersicon TaxID=49274 RepID=A0A3Q7I9A0_SOLLC|nr:probable protein phosphatase 2C 52 [Solanum lycopersicum]XP_015082799.1 probable protein phosphatase 2C 52 [Solanum pennellii]XP_025887874.1 probable protein phosphatase 2C 52 [Solanum lycopersicum]XP_025887875.1 probable protein phosphatase 2C 52 [Solanum lycopersicum]XP_027774390.1 probable protein phosphatase 2C 52 [Solanum pennellii]XP_027774391.1 probable protein phosphatase 2C 52 [Solanum pennellii]XP_027774392.1 probable protein phosphatase 2C 52 [Solanum pennellii]XP_027774393.1 p